MTTPNSHQFIAVSWCLIVAYSLSGCVYSNTQPLIEGQVTSPTPPSIKSASPTYVKITKRNGEVLIDVETNTVQFASLVWQSLSSALANNPETRKFRVSWWMVLGGTTRNSVAIYDRNQHTLEYRSDGGYSGGGVIKEQFKYSQVTDSQLHKAAKIFGQYGSAETGFKNLAQFECKIVKP